MKLEIIQENLKKGLSIVERIASKSLSLPILNNILVSTDKNFIKLSATDLEIGINWWTLVKVQEEGSITIPAHLFSSFVSLLPNKKINIVQEGDSLNIQYEKYKTQIKGVSAEEFPIIPKVEEGEFITLDALSFCQSLSQVVDIAVLSTTRPEISGVLFNFEKDSLVIVATDSFRLGEKKIGFKNKTNLKNSHSLIIPQRAIKEIINIFAENTKEIKMYFSSNQVMFESKMEETDHPHIQVLSRIIDGEYPNYKEIIPSKHSTSIILDRNDFTSQVKAASLFAGKINEVKIKTNENQVEISSQSSELGNHQSFCEGKIKGDKVDASFNHKFLLDGLANIKSSEIILELNGDSGPGVLRPFGDDSYLYVVMPIKSS